MVDSLLGEFEPTIQSVRLIPSKGGVLEVTVDGDLIYSKKATGVHANYDDVAGPIRERT